MHLLQRQPCLTLSVVADGIESENHVFLAAALRLCG